ncbi:MAG TPA: hypothetical protein VL547_22035 [Dinghuibacter sp.]|jgi:hypothetical protein|uniref:DUF6922 domain-containing protein n=1 Tax=Dinghuibacter sp. TaxID=2024697 RepID=UPI002B7D906C|nr:hypothetical protein [Dinghuibacter sp.]HTJ14741.1 hypothetical protein [Dinghuibacter sp.]
MSTDIKYKSSIRPNLARRLFWDFDYESIDWQEAIVTVVQRVMERGNEDEWQELFRFYGRDKVVDTLKYDSNFLPDYAIEKVCRYFGLKPEDLRCYWRKKSRPGYWI